MGRCDNSFLGFGSLCDFPSYARCIRTCRRFWLLRWTECSCIFHDFLAHAWYVSQRKYQSINNQFYLVFFFFSETKQRTLEELDYVFAVPTSKHVSYQVKEFLPYWIRRYVFFQKVELKPLYNFDEVESFTVFEKGVGH